MGGNKTVRRWVDNARAALSARRRGLVRRLPTERERLTEDAVRSGELLALDQRKLPGCYLHRSAPNDVARTEHLTFICSRERDDAGPTNNWMAPAEGYDRLGKIFEGCMGGRTMYVMPFLMGPSGSPLPGGRAGDGPPYVAVSMGIMTRMGDVAIGQLGASTSSRGASTPRRIWTSSDGTSATSRQPRDLERRVRLWRQRPAREEVRWRCGSPASWGAARGGWPSTCSHGHPEPGRGENVRRGAFPRACGKTNLAMLPPTASMKGWRIHTVGDDIVWLRGSGRPAASDQPRGGVLRRSAGHQ